MDVAEYPGIRVSLEAEFDGVITPLKIDVSTGDIIIPREIRYTYRLMLENRSIELLAYNLETVLAEKLETIISRATLNTRMRDFYDIHILTQVYKKNLSPQILGKALEATSYNRGTRPFIGDAIAICNEVEDSQGMQKLWFMYQRKFSYAYNISWSEIMTSVRSVFMMTGIVKA
ncbi:MAG: nucleotidyl transferase AbiEii/AbiGii toxin family protein [Sphaerochaeta sp.]|nr:nucleotidyl transferase AbiEii/AbiGii toxin family protein [Sphaerochaeta sp.]